VDAVDWFYIPLDVSCSWDLKLQRIFYFYSASELSKIVFKILDLVIANRHWVNTSIVSSTGVVSHC